MNAADKVSKLLTLARDPAATPGEAATAQRLAQEICSKYGIRPAERAQTSSSSARALPGNISPAWQSPSPYGYNQPRQGIFRGAPEINLSSISTDQARQMALEILSAVQGGRRYLLPQEEDLIRGAFDGLLTEFGKILLMGLHTITV